MQISPEERPESRSDKAEAENNNIGKLALLVISIVILGGLGYFLFNQTGSEETVPEIISLEAPTLPPTPTEPDTVTAPENKINIPEQTPTELAESFVLPPLDDSDAKAIHELNQLSNSEKLSNWVYPEHLIRRSVTFLDGLSRGLHLSKMHKIPTPKKPFLVTKEGNKLWLNPDNYRRYNYFINIVKSIDNDKLIASFHRFRPLLEEAYGELGYAPKDLDHAIIAALDQILATPARNESIELTRDSVLYKYEDPRLEALSPIQKQLIRMGPANTRIIQKKVLLLRKALLNRS